MKSTYNKPYQKFFLVVLTLGLCVGFVLSANVMPDIDDPQTMILYLNFTNDSSIGESYTNSDGDIIFDYSTVLNNATLANGTYDASGGYMSNGAFDFDGIDDKVDISSVGDLNLHNQSYTICAWYYVKQNNVFFGEGTANDYIKIQTTALVEIEDADDNFFNHDFGKGFALNSWHHVCLLFNSTSDEINLCVDGSCRIPETNNLVLHYNTKYFGQSKSTNNYNGSVDDLIIYDKTLSLLEVATIYDNYAGCGKDPFQGCSCTIDTTFDTGTYFLNDSGLSGAVKISNDNVVLDCNSSILFGNDSVTNGVTGIYAPERYNIKYLNCNTTNYQRGLRLKHNRGVEINNSYSYNNALGLQIENVSFANFTNLVIVNSSLMGFASAGDTYNLTIDNVNVTGARSQHCFQLKRTGDSVIRNSYAIDCYWYGIDFFNVSSNDLAENNVIINASNGLIFSMELVAFNLTSRNNRIYNITSNAVGDGYGLAFNDVVDGFSYNDYIHNANKRGLSIVADNVNIYVENITLDENQESSIHIGANSTNVFITDATITNANTSFFLASSRNITIVNSIINSNDNHFGRIFKNTNDTNFTNVLGWNFYIDTATNLNFNLTNNYSYFDNKNDSLTTKIQMSQLTNALIYTSNGSTPCSDIPNCNGNINITLGPNNYSFIVENYNITEGTTRENSPMFITSTSESITTRTININ